LRANIIQEKRDGRWKNSDCCSWLLFITLLVCCVSFGYAEEYKVFTEPLAPVHFEENGKVKGIATEIVEEIFKEAKLQPTIEVYPWKRSYQMALNQKNSFIYTINRTTKREPLFQWIGPILSKKTQLFKLASRKDIKINSIDDVKKYTTAVILGHSLTTMLIDKGFREGRELVTTPNKKVQTKVFLKGRADLITGNQYTISQSLIAEGYSLEDIEPVFFISSKGYFLGANLDSDEELIKRLIQANSRVQKSGIVNKIVDKYMK
jgi:polar amino acid transport system substrate-binding protein